MTKTNHATSRPQLARHPLGSPGRSHREPRLCAPATRFLPAALAWFTIVVLATGSAPAQQCRHYDAALGTLPDQQGWTRSENRPSAITMGVAAGMLSFDTTPFVGATCAGGSPTTPVEDQFVFWSAATPFDLADGAALTIDLRVHASEYNSSGCIGWPRPGFSLGFIDSNGHRFWVGLGSSTIFLANDGYVPFTSAGVVQAAFNTTGAFHVYRLEGNGASATLRIDGVAVLSLSSFGAPQGVPPQVFFGDPTVWANSDVDIRSVAFVLGVPATEVVRAGSPANPIALLGGQTSGPVLGATWDPRLDHTSFVPAAVLDAVLIAFSPANVPLPGIGTVLCDPTALLALVALPGAPFAIALPPDCTFLGYALCIQGLSFDAAGFQLTNAIDATLGNQ